MCFPRRVALVSLFAVMLGCGPLSAPAAPTDLSATLDTLNSVRLQWLDRSDDESEFVIERGLTASTLLQISMVAENVTAFDDYDLAPGTTYFYRVRANNSYGLSDSTQIVQITTPEVVALPKAPTGLTAANLSASSIRLAWMDNSNNELGFELQRMSELRPLALTGAIEWQRVVLTAANTTSFDDMGLELGVQYAYRVRALNSLGPSGWSNTIYASTSAEPTLPAAPTALEASSLSPTSIHLVWTDNANNETEFVIERGLRLAPPAFGLPLPVEWKQAAIIPGHYLGRTVSYDDVGLTPRTAYLYRVSARNGVGSSPWSNVAEATTQMVPRPPAAPSQLKAIVAPYSYAVGLIWRDNSNNETGFRVERAPSEDGPWVQIALTAPDVTRYGDGQFQRGVGRWYRVCATNEAGNSRYTNVVFVP